MKYLISAFLLVLSFAPLAAQADVAPAPGTHEFSTYAVFDNLTDYPDWDVYVSLYWRFGPTPVLAVDAAAPAADRIQTNGHPSSTGTPFYAVRKADESKIIHKDDPNGEQGDIWNTLPENQKYIITADVTGEGADLTSQLVNGGNLPDSNPTVYIAWVYHIDRITNTSGDSHFSAHFVNESRYDDHGNLVAADPSQVTPVSLASTAAAAPQLPMTLVWIVIVCMGAVILALAVKTWKK